jgi:hypothetical protein
MFRALFFWEVLGIADSEHREVQCQGIQQLAREGGGN